MRDEYIPDEDDAWSGHVNEVHYDVQDMQQALTEDDKLAKKYRVTISNDCYYVSVKQEPEGFVIDVFDNKYPQDALECIQSYTLWNEDIEAKHAE